MIPVARDAAAKQNALSIAVFDDGLFSSMQRRDQRAANSTIRSAFAQSIRMSAMQWTTGSSLLPTQDDVRVDAADTSRNIMTAIASSNRSHDAFV